MRADEAHDGRDDLVSSRTRRQVDVRVVDLVREKLVEFGAHFLHEFRHLHTQSTRWVYSRKGKRPTERLKREKTENQERRNQDETRARLKATKAGFPNRARISYANLIHNIHI